MPKHKAKRWRVEFTADADSVKDLVLALGNAAVALGGGWKHFRVRGRGGCNWRVKLTEAPKK